MIPPYSQEERPMAFLVRGLLGIGLVCLLAGSSSLAFQTRALSVNDCVYTEEQATRGQAAYNARCSSCHGDDLAGRVRSALAGDDFLAGWSTKPLLEVANQIRRTMTLDESG